MTTLILALTAGCGGDSDSGVNADGKLSITVAAQSGSIPGMPILLAQEKGIFAKHGLDAELIPGLRGGAALLTAVTSGTADVVAHAVTTVAKTAQTGKKIPLVAAQSVGAPYVLVVRKDYGSVPAATPGPDGWQETIKALKGASIAGSGASTPADFILRGLFTDAGLSESDFTNINIKHGGPEVAALKSGQVDAVFADIGTALSLVSDGGGVAVIEFAKQGPKWLSEQAWSGQIASQTTLDAKPELAARFHAAMQETQDYIKDPANLGDLRKFAVETAKVPDHPELDSALTAFASMLRPTFTTAQLQTTLDFMKRTGQLKADPAVNPADLAVPAVIG
ncbi:ABC transporter substrate-binding protein [Spirillospora sp. NPDC048819]|uniref:ABC transporter substrate-binding protein n=1 Tax=Spirillospora sp. NPDC048819 TaxID=3155268 RepID=UPI00340506E4